MTALEFPQYNAKVAASLEGTAANAGGLPQFLGIQHTEVGAGVLRAEIEVRDELRTPFGNLHGGVLAALCDHVLGTVLYPVIPRGVWAATTEFKINYLAPITTGVLVATARILSLTKRTAVVRIDVENEGRLGVRGARNRAGHGAEERIAKESIAMRHHQCCRDCAHARSGAARQACARIRRAHPDVRGARPRGRANSRTRSPAAGVGPTDRVAFLDKNGFEYFEVTFALGKLNAVNVAVNWRLAPAEIAGVINDAQAKVLIVGREFAPHIEKIERDLETVTTIIAIDGHAALVRLRRVLRGT